VERVAVDAKPALKELDLNFCAIVSKRLGGRTWLLEVNVNDKEALALTGRMGSKPWLSDYWELAKLAQELATGSQIYPTYYL